jgi:membrane protein
MVATMMFGLDVLSKEEPKGGFIFEDMKAMVSGALLYGFMLMLIFTGQKILLLNMVQQFTPWAVSSIEFLNRFNALPVIFSLGFFTIFYKWTILLPLSWKDSFKGAMTFVACLMAGKSFYWVYIQLMRADIQANYGNFETLITAVLWVYFMMCAFFYGASMAALPHLEHSTKPNASETPEIPLDKVA